MPLNNPIITGGADEDPYDSYLEYVPLAGDLGVSPRSATSWYSETSTLGSSPSPHTTLFPEYYKARSPSPSADPSKDPFSSSSVRVGDVPTDRYAPFARRAKRSDDKGGGYAPLLDRQNSYWSDSTTIAGQRSSREGKGPVRSISPGALLHRWATWRLRRKLLCHLVFCAFIWVILAVAVQIINTKNRSINFARVVVNVFCMIGGTAVGTTLSMIAERWLESAAWMKILRTNGRDGNASMTVRGIKKVFNGNRGVGHGLSLLFPSWKIWKRDGRRQISSLGGRALSTLLFFLLLCCISMSISFVLNRFIILTTTINQQSRHFTEVAVAGDLSQVDLNNAAEQESAFEDYIRTWTLTSFSSQSSPTNVSFPYNGDNVYFAEVTLPQVLPGGSGIGTFDVNATMRDSPPVNSSQSAQTTGSGSVLRFPRWGMRIHCESLADFRSNMIPMSITGLTYVFLTGTQIKSLYSSFDMDVPATVKDTVFDQSKVLSVNDTLSLNLSDTSFSDVLYGGTFYNAGYGFQMWSIPTDMGESGEGWTSIESVLVRLNTSYAPSSKFPVYGSMMPDVNGNPTYIGYDFAVCLRRIEPYLLEVYNSTIGTPTSLRVVEKSNGVASAAFPAAPQIVHHTLNSTGKFSAYVVAHDNSVNQMVKDNGRDVFYAPSPLAVSFTSGHGPRGYTTLDPGRYAAARALADATNFLPYLVGRGLLLAHAFPDETVTRAGLVEGWYIFALSAGLAGIGVLAALCVPRLPDGVPHRDFGLYSWLAGVVGGEFVCEDPEFGRGLRPGMDLEEIKARVRDVKLKHVAAT